LAVSAGLHLQEGASIPKTAVNISVDWDDGGRQVAVISFLLPNPPNKK